MRDAHGLGLFVGCDVLGPASGGWVRWSCESWPVSVCVVDVSRMRLRLMGQRLLVSWLMSS